MIGDQVGYGFKRAGWELVVRILLAGSENTAIYGRRVFLLTKWQIKEGIGHEKDRRQICSRSFRYRMLALAKF
jgi:hypothetical protein